MSKISELASGQITPTEAITVVLVEPDDIPATVIIHWPGAPSKINPRDFGDVAALLTRVFARAATKLARIKKSRK